jgi:hypothetical protein
VLTVGDDVGVSADIVFVVLQPATGPKVAVGPVVKGRPVIDAAVEVVDVDVVEVVGRPGKES